MFPALFGLVFIARVFTVAHSGDFFFCLLQIKCYHKSGAASEREVVFRLQFHTGAVQGYNLMFEKEDLETANKGRREGGKRLRRSQTGLDVQQPLKNTSSGPPSLLALSFSFFFYTDFILDLALSNQQFTFPKYAVCTQRIPLPDNNIRASIFCAATLMAFLCARIPDPRFADYGKVELVFSEGPEKIPGR